MKQVNFIVTSLTRTQSCHSEITRKYNYILNTRKSCVSLKILSVVHHAISQLCYNKPGSKHRITANTVYYKTCVSRSWDYDEKIYIKSLKDVKVEICGKSKRWKERKNEYPYSQGMNRNQYISTSHPISCSIVQCKTCRFVRDNFILRWFPSM